MLKQYDSFTSEDILNYTVGKGEYNPAYDVSGDGKINSYDASLLMRQSKKPTITSVDEPEPVAIVDPVGSGNESPGNTSNTPQWVQDLAEAIRKPGNGAGSGTDKPKAKTGFLDEPKNLLMVGIAIVILIVSMK